MVHRITLVVLASTLVSCQVLPELAPMLVDATLTGISRRKCPQVSPKGVSFNSQNVVANSNQIRVQNLAVTNFKLMSPIVLDKPACLPPACNLAMTIAVPNFGGNNSGGDSSNSGGNGNSGGGSNSSGGGDNGSGGDSSGSTGGSSGDSGSAPSSGKDDDPSWYCDFIGRDVDACATVVDEYDELLVSDRLVRPREYVETLRDGLSDRAFAELQPTGFRLVAERAGRGIAIFRTNENSIGKLLFHWEEAPGSGGMSLEIENAVVYREGEGDKPLGPMLTASLLPSQAVDLDPQRDDDTIPAGPDLFVWKGKDGTHHIQAAPGVVLDFPTSSFCGNN